MTTNIDRATEIIHDHHDNCLDAANALADDGLLMPDIPPVTHVALTTLAADTVEYTVEALYDGHWREPALGYGYRWTDNYDWAAASLAGWRKHHPNEQFRIIARRISPEWVVTDE